MSTSDTRHAKARALMKNFRALPSLSNSAAELLSAMGSRRVTSTRLAQIIERDVALAANVQKVANSPFYGQSRNIATIERAVVLLGVDVIRNIALASSLARVFRGGKLTKEFHIGTLWRHSLAVAALTDALAKHFAPACRERAFTAGLLHDVGFLIELTLAPLDFVALVKRLEEGKERSRRLIDLEREIFGASHDEFGPVLLEQWLLPEDFSMAAAAHHRLDAATGDGTLAALVLVADHLSDAVGAPLLLDERSDAARAAALAALGTDLQSVEAVAADLAPQIEALSTDLGT